MRTITLKKVIASDDQHILKDANETRQAYDQKRFKYHKGAAWIDCKGANRDYCDKCGWTNRA